MLIVDDHPVVRDGLSAIISTEPDLTIVGEVGTGGEAVQACLRLRPKVVLMDLLLPDMNGCDAITQVTDRLSDVSIIVLTTLGGDEEIYRALEAGARGYLFKDMVREDLIHAIRAVQSGKRYIPPQVGARLAESLPRLRLTSREVEILRLVGAGQRNKEIAYELAISEATVNAHVKHILQKLDASDRTQAVTIALRRGIIRL